MAWQDLTGSWQTMTGTKLPRLASLACTSTISLQPSSFGHYERKSKSSAKSANNLRGCDSLICLLSIAQLPTLMHTTSLLGLGACSHNCCHTCSLHCSVCLWEFCRRPTFFPSSRLQPPRQPSMSSFGQQAVTRFLAGYVNSLAELAAPKAALAVLCDGVRTEAYAAAMCAAARELPGELHVSKMCSTLC